MDKRKFRRVQENLLKAVEQDDFNEEFRWYRDVSEGEAEASDPNLEEQQTKDKKEVSTMEDDKKDGSKVDTRRAVFPSKDVRFK